MQNVNLSVSSLLRPDESRQSEPLEPLHSILSACSTEVLEQLKNDLKNYKCETQLDEIFEDIGLTRREYLRQVNIVAHQRKSTSCEY